MFLEGTIRQDIRQYMAVTSVVEFWSNSADTIQSSGGEGGSAGPFHIWVDNREKHKEGRRTSTSYWTISS